MQHILNKQGYDIILEGKDDLLNFLSENDIAFNIVPMLVIYLENVRKRSDKISNTEIKQFLYKLSDGNIHQVANIALTPSDLSNAILDDEFLSEEIGKRQNPYILSSKIAVKYRNEEEIWWDVDELIAQLIEINNG